MTIEQRKVEHSIKNLPSLLVAGTVQVPQGMETLALKFELVVFISGGADSHVKRTGVCSSYLLEAKKSAFGAS